MNFPSDSSFCSSNISKQDSVLSWLFVAALEHERSNCLESFDRELTTLEEREIITLMIVFLDEYLSSQWK